tara:strand:+ start:26 stop:700 length:675 start_codon:yes stop_codon:yes gene_type:complete
MEPITLNTTERTQLGKKVRSLRKVGILPLHVYGPGIPSVSLQSETSKVLKAIQSAGRTNPVKIIVNDDQVYTTLVRHVDQHPATGALQHVDFLKVDENKAIEVEVPIVLEGDAPGIRGGAGTVTQAIYAINVLSKPFSVPNEIVADVSVLIDLETYIKSSDLILPEGVELAGDPDASVAWIQPPRVQEEIDTAEDGLAEGETSVIGDEGVEGEEGSSEESKESK